MKKLFIITILVSFALGQEDQMYDTIFMKNGKKRLATYIEITNQGGILIRNKGANIKDIFLISLLISKTSLVCLP